MKIDRIGIPTFTFKPFPNEKPYPDDCAISSQKEYIKANLVAMIDAFDDCQKEADCIVICCRQKIGDEYKYGMATSILNRDADLISVNVGEFNMPYVLVAPRQKKTITSHIEELFGRIFDKLLLLV
jgi:hypothetical protein